MSLVHLNAGNFDETISSGMTLVDFWAGWCGPCMAFGPIFESVADRVPGIKFAKFEVTESERRTPAKYGIRSIPSILAFKNGELVESRAGMMQPMELHEWVVGIK